MLIPQFNLVLVAMPNIFAFARSAVTFLYSVALRRGTFFLYNEIIPLPMLFDDDGTHPKLGARLQQHHHGG